MADNIKIIGNIVNTTTVSRYSVEDTVLIPSQELFQTFNPDSDYIEYYIYDIGGNLLNIDYNYTNFKSSNTVGLIPPPTSEQVGIVSNTEFSSSISEIEIDPVKDLQNLGFQSGEFRIQYNFFSNILSSPNAELFIKEISSDRTEIRVISTLLTNEQIENAVNSLINKINTSNYYVDFLVNFGNNVQALAVNVALNKAESGYEILLKLYQPLSSEIEEKSTLWIVDEKVSPYVFDINLDTLITPAPGPQLRGPNFSIKVDEQNNTSTSYQTFDTLIGSLQSIQSSSYQQLLSLTTSQSIDINVDYSNFSNFIVFSSADKRINNFYNKVKQIEDYRNYINTYSPYVSTTSSLQNEINNWSASINTIISNFDQFEYYLYFESSSVLTSSVEFGVTPYPKSTSLKPYVLFSTSSILVETWLNEISSSAVTYDLENKDNLIYSVPSFIQDDEENHQYLTFLNMMGQYFDNIWIYINSITDINLANNNLEKGISKDLVYFALQSLGINLYNKFGDSDTNTFLVGNNSGSVNFDNDFSITGSYLNNIPRKDLLAESYKRIYHNLPLLLKTKGTSYGLQTLISTFGITGSILQVKEYGGDLKSNTLDEFNNDKVRIISSSVVSGSVLSPYVSVVEYPTASTLFRTNDLQYVDISFSPQDKIDIFTSASIASTNPTWSIDDFIGDPRLQYSSSYTELETERTKYLSPLSASLIPFTSSVNTGSIGATNYNDFIRLIQFFDNSLFKMLKDYVPARTNLSTGVTISSPILERNKWVIANPSQTSKVDVKEGSIAGPTIGTEYDPYYYKLSGSRKAYFDGNIEGSYINVHSYFVSGNFNPYLFPTSSLTPGDLYIFKHTDFDILSNNVSSSVVSRTRRDIEYIFGTTGSILTPAELQDSYESLRCHQLSRYEGVKLIGTKYNEYVDGDISFGKSAVINQNVIKLGLFSEIVTNRFLPRRSNAVLKYLVNIDGDLTELNLRNKHWEEIQNTFIAGDTGSISQFNNQLYGNQKITDGEKEIFDSGYSYNPILYFAGSDTSIAFTTTGAPVSYLATAQNTLSPNAFISGSTSNRYALSSSFVTNLFDRVIEGSSYFVAGTSTTFPTYSVQETGNHTIQISLPFTYEVETSPVNEATWSLQVLKSGSAGIAPLTGSNSQPVIDRQFFVAGDPATSTLTFVGYNNSVFYFELSNAIPSTNVVITYASVYGFSNAESCSPLNIGNSQDSLISATITAGNVVASGSGSTPLSCSDVSYRRDNNMLVNGQFVTNNSVITIGRTQVTVVIPPDCEGYSC